MSLRSLITQVLEREIDTRVHTHAHSHKRRVIKLAIMMGPERFSNVGLYREAGFRSRKQVPSAASNPTPKAWSSLESGRYVVPVGRSKKGLA